MFKRYQFSATRAIRHCSLSLMVFATFLGAESAHSKVRTKNKTQSSESAQVKRIKAGYAGGWLSRTEATRLLNEQKNIEVYRKKLERNTKALAYEKAQLKKMQDQAYRKIYKQKDEGRSSRQLASARSHKSKANKAKYAQQKRSAKVHAKSKVLHRQNSHTEEQALVSN